MIRIDGRSQTQLRPVRLWSDLFRGLPAATTRLTVVLTVEAGRTRTPSGWDRHSHTSFFEAALPIS
jgi:hypothetical protein